MKLEGYIYRIRQREPRRIIVDLVAGCPVYAAHFPGHPVTPGAVLVGMAAEMLAPAGTVSGARDIRFLVPVPPGAEGVIFAFEPLEDGVWSVVVGGRGVVYAKMRLLL